MPFLIIIAIVMAGCFFAAWRESLETAIIYAENALITYLFVVMAFYAAGIIG